MNTREICFFLRPSCEIDRSLSSLPEKYRPTIRNIRSVSDVLDDPAFEKDTSLVDVWTDFDGVMNHLFQNDNDPYKWVFFRSIARHARSIHIVSMRIPVQEESGAFPFFSHRLQERIRRVLLKINPDCHVDFHLGFGKMLNHRSFERFSSMIADLLDQHVPVVLLGSSIFDRIRLKKLINELLFSGRNDLSLLRYYDTGRVLI